MPLTSSRLRTLLVIFLAILTLIVARLFYLQIVKGDDYLDVATRQQVSVFEIEAQRGRIYAHNGDEIVPLVYNEPRWLLYSDTSFIEDCCQDLIKTLLALGLDIDSDEQAALESPSKYVVLERYLTEAQKQAVEDTGLKGLYFNKQSIRGYAEDNLAAHVLGFLNNDLKGQYGVEQSYNEVLTGTPGRLRAITNVSGVPLSFSGDNIAIAPQDGQDLVLSLDIPLQRSLEDNLARVVKSTDGSGGAGVILNAQTGQIVALAGSPTFDPAQFSQQTDLGRFVNPVISDTLEPASVVKTLVMAAALDQGVVETNDTYHNPAFYLIDGHEVNNARYNESVRRSMSDILRLSLNTGTIYLLHQLGNGHINQTARQALYDYYTNKFRLGQVTNVDLPGEAAGQIHPPSGSFGVNIRYANMTFGQGMTSTLMQIAAAYAAIFNGGTYYRPYVVEKIGDKPIPPTVVAEDILKQKTIADLRQIMTVVGNFHFPELQRSGLEVSAKTGTGQIASPEGGYIEDRFNGLAAGYIQGDDQTLVMVTWVEKP